MTDSIINKKGGIYINTVGENIKRIRKNLKISQESLGNAVGLTADYISKLETGKRGNPSWDALEKIASVLKCSVIDLIGDNNIKEYKELTIAKVLKETYLKSNEGNPNRPNAQTVTNTIVQRLINEGIIDGEGNISPKNIKLLEEAIRLDAKLHNNLKKPNE